MPYGAPAQRRKRIFTASGVFNVPSDVELVEVVIVGGGGGAGSGAGAGGGGAGGVIRQKLEVVPGAAMTVTVGAGGLTTPTDGGDSSFGGLTALGGGKGGETNGVNGGDGGSGGGGASNRAAGSTLDSDQGHNGGDGLTLPGPIRFGGGGGGGGAAGADANGTAQTAGAGGEGVDVSDLTSVAESGWVGGGASGGSGSATQSDGGRGGGGFGAAAGPTGLLAPIPNSGGGGGGFNGGSSRGEGADGIVIITWAQQALKNYRPRQKFRLGAGTLPTPIVDGAARGAAFAYSIRQLRAEQSKCMRVVRSSDSAEMDIGFVNGVLDVHTLRQWVGEANGAISVWYDQSGNGNDATAGVGQRSVIVDATGGIDGATINYQGGFPAVRPTGNNRLFATGLTIPEEKTFFVVADTRPPTYSADPARRLVSSIAGSIGDECVAQFNAATPALVFRDRGAVITDNGYTAGRHLHYFASQQAALEMGYDGGNTTSGGAPSGPNLNALYLLEDNPAAGGAVDQQPRYIQEVIGFDSDRSADRVDIDDNINEFFGIY